MWEHRFSAPTLKLLGPEKLMPLKLLGMNRVKLFLTNKTKICPKSLEHVYEVKQITANTEVVYFEMNCSGSNLKQIFITFKVLLRVSLDTLPPYALTTTMV